MKSKKIIMLLVLVFAIVLVLTGCEKKSNKSYTFNVETGDKIEIKMDTTDGYNLTSELPIEFSKDDEVISQGIFAQEYAYDEYYKKAKNDSNATIIEEKSNDNIEYFFYEYNNSEYNYIIKIKDSKTCFILGNDKSKKSAQEIFERLEFEVK
ncbi:MAG: hypothetical protein IKD77_04780 [Bacilli bacterium]|nr:hypothetical protein [Bacilli bacterium]